MKHKKRIIVGPTQMRVQSASIQSDVREIGEQHSRDDVLAIADELWATIRRLVYWEIYLRHRCRMAAQRRLAGAVAAARPDLRFPGPRPDLIAARPWADARHGEWAMLPHGVVARLIRGGKG